jgi:hypothetical protein
VLSGAGSERVKPRWIVCEDGDEYLTRFSRFLGDRFEFTPASDLDGALAAIPGAQGLLLDLDFRRTDPARLVDESGVAQPQRAAGERARLSEVQGIFILRALRSRGVLLPALLCADLDDAERVARLQSDLAPLQIVPGSEGVFAIAERMRRVTGE